MTSSGPTSWPAPPASGRSALLPGDGAVGRDVVLAEVRCGKQQHRALVEPGPGAARDQQHKADRQQADADILACVKQAQGPGMAQYMYANVRWGGSPYWMSSYRWGYGWNYLDGIWPRGYKLPTAEEQAQIAAQLPAAQALMARDIELYPASKDKEPTPAPAN